MALKSLIRKRFNRHPEFLWITLLIDRRQSPPALENQGFGWIAHLKSKVISPYESSTCERYWFYSNSAAVLGYFAPRNTTFVHKSSAARRILHWTKLANIP
jgi:hypothetical protein